MGYAVKELFYTLQGEGARAGRAAVFCRFAGCNLWTGREEDRARAVCQLCDTQFVGTDGVGGGKHAEAASLAEAIDLRWPRAGSGTKYVVFTGGEPLLQLDAALIEAVHARGFEIAIETNGTLPVPAGVDWICVSPKAGAELVVRRGHELKLVYPQAGAEPERFEGLDFEHFFLQPMAQPPGGPLAEAWVRDPRHAKRVLDDAIAHCMAHPRWRLSLQTHKLIGIP